LPEGCGHYDGVNDIKRFGPAEQPSRLMRFALAKRNDHAPSQEAAKLRLLWGPADLGDHRCGNEGNNAKFQPGLVFCPCSPLASVGGNENGGVIDDSAHAERRTVRDFRS